jgi:hypothetical protein
MSDRLDYYFTEIEDLMLPIVSRSVTTEFIDHSDAGPYERLLSNGRNMLEPMSRSASTESRHLRRSLLSSRGGSESYK